LSASSLQYQSDYSQDQQRQQQQQSFPQYGSGMMYNVAEQSSQGAAVYDPTQQFQSRQPAAMEVLSNMAVPQYYVSGEPTSTSISAVHSQQAPQYPSLPYQQHGSLTRTGLSQSYGQIADLPSAPQEQMDEQEYDQAAASSFDDAYNQYQTALRRTFENTRNGILAEAGQSLMEITEWLLSHAVDLGEHRNITPTISVFFFLC
jgi:hypothetical protein